MKILICGAGAIGSNLVRNLVPDLKGKHEITVLDMDVVEERNVTPGTQWYTPDQIGLPKVEALQFNVYNTFQREINIHQKEIFEIHDFTIEVMDEQLDPNQENGTIFVPYDLVIDCFDNQEARAIVQTVCKAHNIQCLHIGFSDQFTFEIEWKSWYQVPTDITTGMDICEMPGAAGFVNSVASLGALVVEKYLEKNEKMRVLGGKYQRSFVS